MPPTAYPSFAGLESPASDYETRRSVILPVPFERTTSWIKGTARGPAAILEASCYVELYDEELETEPFRQGIATVAPVSPAAAELTDCLAEIEGEALRHLQQGKFLVTLGGEHSLTLGPVRAARQVHKAIGVVQFDAHADLRDEYHGTPYSHACVMRRALDEALPTLAVGVRSLTKSEADLVRERHLPMVWGQELPALTPDRFRELLSLLPKKVYLTFDVDFFDPALLPATGTPEPGGTGWLQTIELLRTLFASKDVVAMDVVELCPIPGQHASDFVIARLVYKCLGYLQAAG
ncbi:MAG: agmatinase [Thermoanaerobaculia bacterium]